jgi:hypothetical protein
MLDESIIKINPLDLLDRNNQDLKGKDSIVVNTSLTMKCNKGHSCKYADITLFL